jgi:hypothetical protein
MVFFAVAGAAAAMPIGMNLFSSDPIYGRLELKIGAVCVLCGAIAGFMLGAILWGLVTKVRRYRSLARLVSLVLLCATVGIEIGWFYHANTPVEHWPPEGGSARLRGGVFGAGVGVLLWLIDHSWLHGLSEKSIVRIERPTQDSV